jgi:hypothetical protein
MRTDGIILYRTKATDGITQSYEDNQDYIVQAGLNRTKRTDEIRQNLQDTRDHTRSAEHKCFDRINWTDGLRRDQQDKWD